LLSNAIKYTPRGGLIGITAESGAEEACIVVRDNGIGVAEEALPQIFELFVQAHQGLDRAYGGLGIGLSLVKRLTELHGGRIEGRSAGPGQGSEFILRLPLPGARGGSQKSPTEGWG
jgi:signal transduction histidine kinase